MQRRLDFRHGAITTHTPGMSEHPEVTNYRKTYLTLGGTMLVVSLLCSMSAIGKVDDVSGDVAEGLAFLLVIADLAKWVGIAALVVGAVCHVTEIDRFPAWRRRPWFDEVSDVRPRR